MLMFPGSSPKRHHEKSGAPCYKGAPRDACEFDLASLREEFVTNLKKWMRVKRMKPLALAEAMGVSQSQISHWTSGTNYPNADQMDRIAAALDIPRQYLTYDRAHPRSGHPEYEMIAKTNLPVEDDGGAMMMIDLLGSLDSGQVKSAEDIKDFLRSRLQWPSKDQVSAAGSGGSPPSKKRPPKRKKKTPSP